MNGALVNSEAGNSWHMVYVTYVAIPNCVCTHTENCNANCTLIILPTFYFAPWNNKNTASMLTINITEAVTV